MENKNTTYLTKDSVRKALGAEVIIQTVYGEFKGVVAHITPKTAQISLILDDSGLSRISFHDIKRVTITSSDIHVVSNPRCGQYKLLGKFNKEYPQEMLIWLYHSDKRVTRRAIIYNYKDTPIKGRDVKQTRTYFGGRLIDTRK